MLGCPEYVLERRLCIYLGHSEFSAASGKSCTLLVQVTLKYIYEVGDFKTAKMPSV